MLHPLATFTSSPPPPCSPAPPLPRSHYTGQCPRTGNPLSLPRTEQIESIARGLMRQLGSQPEFREGKMYGVLLVETTTGEKGVLKAFSGLLNGERTIAGWVPPIPGRDRVALAEAETLAELEAIKQALIHLHQISERQVYQERSEFWQQQLAELTVEQQQRKQARQAKREILQATLIGRELAQALETLDNESRRDKRDRRQLKQQRDAELIPLKQILDRTDARILELKRQRKDRSRHLQAQLYTAYRLTNFAGETASLDSLMPEGFLPTGTGDCCAPKLLHYAATHGLKAIALAEFWWGEPSADGEKVPGQFYGACAERCQPIMGFLLSGLSAAVQGVERSPSPSMRERTEPTQLDLASHGSPSRPPNPPMLGGTEPQTDLTSHGSPSRPPNPPMLGETEPQTDLLQKTVFTIQSPPRVGDLGGNAGSVRSTYNLTILFEDEFLVAIDKPAGLLSVPGRTGDRQDSVLSRLWSGGVGSKGVGSRGVGEQGAGSRGDSKTLLTHPLIHPSTHPLIHPSTPLPVHRLDQDTSGVLLFAKDREGYRSLSCQFAQRQVQKIYEAILDGVLGEDEGTIDLPLWSDPDDRPYQKVDWGRGKASVTQFRVIERFNDQTRVELIPLTGRTHQLRVHSAIGLRMSIRGDRLYGRSGGHERLYLHARELRVRHPKTGVWLQIRADLPF